MYKSEVVVELYSRWMKEGEWKYSSRIDIRIILSTLWTLQVVLELIVHHSLRNIHWWTWLYLFYLPGDPLPCLYSLILDLSFQIGCTRRRWLRNLKGCRKAESSTNYLPVSVQDMTDSSTLRRLNSSNQEFRLLRVSTGGGNAEIRVSTEVAFLDEAPRYIALSYVWGNDIAQEPVKVDGVDVYVTSNLLEFLRFICEARGTAHVLPFWIDALSINQSDHTERSEQVAVMKEIYSKAYKVWVWLGLPSETTEFALAKISALQSVMTKALQHESHPDEPADMLSINPMWCLLLSAEERHRHEVQWKSLYEILQSPWWTRAWIVQEASSPDCLITHFGNPELILGRQLQTIPLLSTFCFIPMVIRMASATSAADLNLGSDARLIRSLRMIKIDDEFLKTLNLVDGLRNTVSYSASMHFLQRLGHSVGNFERLTDVERLRQGQSITQRVLGLFAPRTDLDRYLFRTKVGPILEVFRPTKASDPRDKVYACVPMVLPSGHTAIRPDYSLSMCEVYVQVVKDFIQHEGTLSILSSCDAGAVDLPSFVPDWRVPTQTHAFRTYVNESNECIYQAATVRAATAKVTKESTLLEGILLQGSAHRLGSKPAMTTQTLLVTSGVLVDHIVAISSPYADSKRFRRQRWEAILSTLPDYYTPTHEPLTCAYQRLLAGDIYSHEDHNVWRTKLPMVRKFASAIEALEMGFGRWLNRGRVDKLSWNLLKELQDKDPLTVRIAHRGARADPTVDIRKPWSVENQNIALSTDDTTNELDKQAARATQDKMDGDLVLDAKSDIPAALFDPGKEQLFRTSVSQVTFNRAFCITNRGYIALVPNGTRTGDCIVVLDGGPVPFVLRSAHPCETSSRMVHGGQRWSLVGESYVHGLMDGEVATLGLENMEFVIV